MRKDLKKNKKGFTLVEIIVVLLIIGILLAITIPSIMGYVEQAKDAQYEAEGRTGFVAAQTIAARSKANGKDADGIVADITALAIGKEMGEITTETAVTANSSIQDAKCTVNDSTKNIEKCAFITKGSKGAKKYVVFEAGKDVEVKAGEALPATLSE